MAKGRLRCIGTSIRLKSQFETGSIANISFSGGTNGSPEREDTFSTSQPEAAKQFSKSVLLTSSEAILSALPSPLLTEAQMFRDRAMSHYQAHSLFVGIHRLHGCRMVWDLTDKQLWTGVGVTIGRRASSSFSKSLKLKELESEPLLYANGLKSLIRLLRLAQLLGKGLLQRLLLHLSAHSSTRAL
ncbi:hypothetical protein CQW23_12234 [Capsicum baccatum]|uniref:Uncharacterized protein n=1 Tax=Capsicum baccatum TaxID=33114 RepID=A0A2G2WRZ8_CAPBA|nr:hypothetical protein CQW23_12234 [Capsicum baccatum]